MPTYDYMCESCKETWENFSIISDRDKPCASKCPHCKEKKVIRGFVEFPSTTTDSTLTANKKSGGQWNELMHKMKNYTPDRLHDRLDQSSSRTGKSWKA
jgi:putative FmdB family regulatory protein